MAAVAEQKNELLSQSEFSGDTRLTRRKAKSYITLSRRPPVYPVGASMKPSMTLVCHASEESGARGFDGSIDPSKGMGTQVSALFDK